MSLSQPVAPEGAKPSTSDRSDEILGLVRTAFARKGFDGTSMNDLAREVGMSVGNFYRYFPSKNALVEALVAHDIAEIEARFTLVLAAEDSLAALRMGLGEYLLTMEHDKCRLIAEISAAAQRATEVAATCARLEEMAAEQLLGVFTKHSGLAPEECRARFGAHARYIVLVIHGFGHRSNPHPDPDLNILILRGINRVLDEIPAKG